MERAAEIQRLENKYSKLMRMAYEAGISDRKLSRSLNEQAKAIKQEIDQLKEERISL